MASWTGITLAVNPSPDGKQLTAYPPGRLAPEIVNVLVANIERVIAAIEFRDLLRPFGFDEVDLVLIMRSILDGQVDSIRIIVPAPPGTRPA
jgi:hypothetical protein